MRCLEWPGCGPCLVLLHGLADCAAVWTPVVEQAEEVGNWIALDLPGHGESLHYQDGHYDLARIVNTTLVALQDLNLEKAILVGHSLGANVALHLATKSEFATAGLVFVELASEVVPQAKQFQASMQELFKLYETPDEFVAELGYRLPNSRAEHLRSYAASALKAAPEEQLVLRTDPSVLALLQQSSVEKKDLLRKIAETRVPNVFVRGEYSGITTARETIEDARQAGSQVQPITIPKSGHHLILDQPRAVAKAICGFVRSVV